ncbi:syntaxin-1A-like, partial [Stegodyphus dumicola]|uniref:syntaxin-1A-like n=1 Tax=Stegodyphus dumicola TaxID=202533 RepID=UPI0015ABB95D
MVIDRLGDLKAVLKDNYEASNEITINMDYTDSYLSEFFMEVESITNSLDKIVASVEELKKKHNAIFSSPTPNEKVKQELESLMADIKRLSSSVRQKLK